ncbi:MAG TPA: SDR family NAD(P)-dependent oxidoreductase [Aestuariivirga sp.]|nr:SDR family NAD(P)-dependent oxidoreductase [Aestuariivirga sp.]
MTERSVLITGCSSGIGHVAAGMLRARGFRVFATARKPEDVARLAAEGFEALALDYEDSASLKACVEEISRRTKGRLYALYNNGAFGQTGALEDVSRDVMRRQFEANVFGWHELTNLCLPLLRAEGDARIINTSSVLGIVAMPFRGGYNASKFAIEALSETLKQELWDTGIRVILINPGPITSAFRDNAVKAFEDSIDEEGSAHHRAAYQKQRDTLMRGDNSFLTLPPEAVVKKVIHALESRNPRPRYNVTLATGIMALGKRLLPQRLFDWFLHAASRA